jgi:vacuolar-type H+-ATPase subunit I/STV1
VITRGTVSTQKIWKIKVIVLKKDTEPVLLLLGRKGVTQPIDINCEAESFDHTLEQNGTSCEINNRILEIYAKTNHLLNKLDLKAEVLTGEPNIPDQKSVENVLSDMEKKLILVENDSKDFFEALSLSSNLEKKIEHKLNNLRIKVKKIKSKNLTLINDSPIESLKYISDKFNNIENSYDNSVRLSTHCVHILKKIMLISKKLNIKIPETETETIPFPPDENALLLIEGIVSENEKSTLNKDLVVKKLAPIKTAINETIKKIPEMQADLIKQILELKYFIRFVRQSIKTDPQLKKIHFELVSIQETLKEIEDLVKIENHIGVCGPTVYLEAWVPKAQIESITNDIKILTKDKCIIEIEPPSEEDNTPTILRPVPRILEAFEKLTFALGYPRPNEINPVFIMAITFPLLFGIMFADVGQGAILLIAGIILTYFRGKVDIKKVGEITRYFLVASGLLILCGISAMFFGFLFGDFFGPSGVLQPILLLTIGPFKIGGFDPMHEPLSLLRFAILIGVILLTFGLSLRVLNNIREKRFKHALISSFWMWLLLGGFTMWIYWGGISNLTRWLTEGNLMLVGLMGLPVLLITVVTASSGGIMEGIDFSIEVLLESLDHTISFSRLAALFLTHAALNHMFLIIAGVEHGIFTLQSIPIIMIGTILALSIEGLIIFVHTLRLHWIELLPEFYSGKGILFKPLKIK